MGVVKLVRTVLLLAVAGLLLGHDSTWVLILALPITVVAVVGHGKASVYPVAERPVGGRDLIEGPGLQPEREPLLRARMALGVVVGLIGAGWVLAFGYGIVHHELFGERVAAVVTDVGADCDEDGRDCDPVHRLTAVESRDDLGWITVCATAERDDVLMVSADPLGWVQPTAAACVTTRETMLSVTYLWLAGLCAILLVRVGAATWMWRRASVPDRDG